MKNLETPQTNGNADNSQGLGKVISVTSIRGGTGKTTTAYLLASMLSKFQKESTGQPLKVCVVDLDVHDGQIGYLMGKSTPNVLTLLSQNSAIVENNVRNNLVYSDAGFHALLMPTRNLMSRHIDASFYGRITDRLREMFDIIIFDTAVINRHNDPMSHFALSNSDKVLLLSSAYFSSLNETYRWVKPEEDSKLAEKGGYNLSDENLKIVVTQAPENMDNQETRKLNLAHIDWCTMSSVSNEIQTLANSGRLEELLDKNPVIYKEYFDLANSLVN